MGVKTYDPKGIVIVVGGVTITGYADGSFVKVSRDENTWEKYKGSDGTGSRSKSNNNGGKVEITLARTSSSNDYLTALHALDEASGHGVVPVLIRDINGTTRHTASAAWVLKPADDESDKKITSRVWTLDCDDLDMTDGGNNSSVVSVVAGVVGIGA